MSNGAVRLAPSGPIVTNPNGGTFTPGTGARLRLAEATCTSSAGNTVPTVPAVIAPALTSAAGAPIPVLPLPSPKLNYRATLVCEVKNASTNATSQVELYLDVSADGVTYVNVASNTHEVLPQNSAAPGQARLIRIDLPLSTGTAIGVVAGQPNLFLRGRIGASVGGGANVSLTGAVVDAKTFGTCDVILEELF
jgi:hypothetical protein